MSQVDEQQTPQTYILLNYDLKKYDKYLIRDYKSLEKNHIYLMIAYDYQIPVVMTNISWFDRENTTTYEFDHIYGDEIREGRYPLLPDYIDFPTKLDINILYDEDYNEHGIKIYDLDAMYIDYQLAMSKLPIVSDVLPIIDEYSEEYNLPNFRSRSRSKRYIGGKKKAKKSRRTYKKRKTRRSTK